MARSLSSRRALARARGRATQANVGLRWQMQRSEPLLNGTRPASPIRASAAPHTSPWAAPEPPTQRPRVRAANESFSLVCSRAPSTPKLSWPAVYPRAARPRDVSRFSTLNECGSKIGFDDPTQLDRYPSSISVYGLSGRNAYPSFADRVLVNVISLLTIKTYAHSTLNFVAIVVSAPWVYAQTVRRGVG